MVRFKVGIPARYNSQRLPGKPLALIAGKPMIQRVYEAACDCDAEDVFIATDSERIADCAHTFGASVCLTASSHTSGSERLAEAAQILGLADDEILVNLQGDEPLTPPEIIHQVAQALAEDETCSVSTLCAPIESPGELANPNVVKVVRDVQDRALYFSRSCIPWVDAEGQCDIRNTQWMRQIGLYAYRVGFLKANGRLEPTKLEQQERLEQLRALWHGHRIRVAVAQAPTVHGIDTPEDLERVNRRFESSSAL